jgi:hypothetical protein
MVLTISSPPTNTASRLVSYEIQFVSVNGVVRLGHLSFDTWPCEYCGFDIRRTVQLQFSNCLIIVGGIHLEGYKLTCRGREKKNTHRHLVVAVVWICFFSCRCLDIIRTIDVTRAPMGKGQFSFSSMNETDTRKEIIESQCRYRWRQLPTTVYCSSVFYPLSGYMSKIK